VTAPIGEPPLEALPPDAPATVEDVRVGRRWTWVALAWAIAASAIAVLALLQAGDDNKTSNTQTQTTPDLTPRLTRFEKETNDRLDAFSRRLSDRAAQSDIQKLDKRLSRAEDDASQAKSDAADQGDTITQLQADVKDLQQRVDDLEQQQQDQQQTP
jgi:septal ring factor EnvC (AmiA/AmiB activator)